LKLLLYYRLVPINCLFPRHHWRGSIEAGVMRLLMSSLGGGFRAIIGAAPLKLQPHPRFPRRRHQFPRHHWRGSIEAVVRRRG